jgi:hypothetical protein
MARGYLTSVEDVRYNNEKTDDYIQEVRILNCVKKFFQFSNYWRELGLDALICPSFPGLMWSLFI